MVSGHSAPRSEKVGRGRAAATIKLGEAAHDVLAGTPYAMTLRQLYYALVSTGAIPKSEAAYGKLKRLMRDLREDGTVPWDWLVDHTRSVFQPRTWDGIEGLLADSARLYRRDLMRSQDVAIQLWAESDSIGSVIAQVADRYTIPTFIGRGYAARGYLWSAARDAVAAHRAGKDVVILHVGDFDPSGEDIFRDVVETLRVYAWAIAERRPAAEVRGYLRSIGQGASINGEMAAAELVAMTDWLDFDRLALTPDQIEEYDLPARPPKASDVRTAKFTGTGTVEVEALPVVVLLQVVEDAIEYQIDPDALAAAKVAEEFGARDREAHRDHPDRAAARGVGMTTVTMSEADLERGVLDLARLYHWRVAHFRPARTVHGWRTPVAADGAGFVDLLMVRGNRILAVELKSALGRLTPEQVAWLAALADAGVDTQVWTPAMYPAAIAAVLAR